MSTVTAFPNRAIDRAIAWTMRWEGGFIDHPSDPGGATNFGISLRFLLAQGKIEQYDFDGDGDVDAADIRTLTAADAALIYRQHFWRPEYARLPELVGCKLFDFGVNMGPGQSVRLLQRALNEYTGITKAEPLIVDGRYGERTATAVNKLEQHASTLLLGDLEDHAARFYYGLAEKRRAARDFLFGWLRRCYARPEL